MPKHFARAVTIVAAAALVASLAACSSSTTSSTSSSGKPESGGDLTLLRVDDATNFLPSEVSQNSDIWTVQEIYETLTAYKADGSGIEPGLATKWSPSSDGLTWKFTLREGVKFHDGSTMTPADVAWSLNYARTTSPTKQWADSYSAITAVEVSGPDSVDISLSAPWAGLPAAVGLYAAAIYPKDFGGKTEEYMRTHTDGTGPFTLATWSQGQSVTLKKSPDYWQKGLPYLDSVTFKKIAADNTRFQQLQGGAAQIDEFPSSATMSTVKSISSLAAEAFPSTAVVYANLNTRSAKLSDPLVRRAMSYAVDRKPIVASVYSGFGKPANSFLSDTLYGHDSSIDGGTYDLAKAKALMAKSSEPKGFDLALQVESGVTDQEQLAQVLQSQWAKLGIRVTITETDFSSIRASRNAGEFEAILGYATSDTVDTVQMVDFLAVTDGSGIRSGYADPTVEAAAEKVASIQDGPERLALLKTIQQKVADDAPMIPLVYKDALYAMSDKVHGFSTTPLGAYSFKSTWLGK